jgi:hypothetical protein
VLNSDPPLAAGRVLILAPGGDGLAGLCGRRIFVLSSPVGWAELALLLLGPFGSIPWPCLHNVTISTTIRDRGTADG